MKEINGKIWIENVDRDVKDVLQLDPKIYKIPMRLMQVGGNIEIGEAIPPEHGNGIYCTNLTMEQISEQVSYVYGTKESEETILEDQQRESEKIIPEEEQKEPEELYMEELEKSSKSKVDSIFASIYRISKDYRIGKTHLLFGVPVGASLDHLVDDYEKNVVPEFEDLSSEEKKELSENLQNLLDNGLFHIEWYFVTNAIERINASLNLPQEGSTPRKK